MRIFIRIKILILYVVQSADPHLSVWLITQSDPIGPNRTQSDPIGTQSDPTGPHRTNPHSTSYFLPSTTGQSFILSLACTLQTSSIIDIQEKLPISTQLRRITFKAYSLLVSKICANCAELRHIVSSYEQTRPALSALNYRVADRRWVDLIAFNWRCHLPWTVCKINLIFKRRSSCLMP